MEKKKIKQSKDPKSKTITKGIRYLEKVSLKKTSKGDATVVVYDGTDSEGVIMGKV